MIIELNLIFLIITLLVVFMIGISIGFSIAREVWEMGPPIGDEDLPPRKESRWKEWKNR